MRPFLSEPISTRSPSIHTRLSRSAPPHIGQSKARTCGLAVFILAILASCSVLWGELTILPTPGKCLGYVSSTEPGKWICISAGEFLPVPVTVLEAGKAIVFEAPPGKYGIFFFPPGDAQPVVQVVVLGQGDQPVPPPASSRQALGRGVGANRAADTRPSLPLRQAPSAVPARSTQDLRRGSTPAELGGVPQTGQSADAACASGVCRQQTGAGSTAPLLRRWRAGGG